MTTKTNIHSKSKYWRSTNAIFQEINTFCWPFLNFSLIFSSTPWLFPDLYLIPWHSQLSRLMIILHMFKRQLNGRLFQHQTGAGDICTAPCAIDRCDCQMSTEPTTNDFLTYLQYKNTPFTSSTQTTEAQNVETELPYCSRAHLTSKYTWRIMFACEAKCVLGTKQLHLFHTSARSLGTGNCVPYVANVYTIFMVALCNTADHYIFALWFLSFFFFSSPNLSGRRLDVDHSSTHGVASVQI